MKTRPWLTKLMLPEAISQNCSAVATAEPARRGGCRRAAVGNGIEGVHDSDVSKRFEGDGFNFTTSMKF